MYGCIFCPIYRLAENMENILKTIRLLCSPVMYNIFTQNLYTLQCVNHMEYQISPFLT